MLMRSLLHELAELMRDQVRWIAWRVMFMARSRSISTHKPEDHTKSVAVAHPPTE